MKTLLIFIYVIVFVCLSGCVSTGTSTETTKSGNRGNVYAKALDSDGNRIKVRKTITCGQPVAKISIAEIQCKATNCSRVPKLSGNMAAILRLSDKGISDFSTLGESMSTMLSHSLAVTGCFTILDRETIEQVKKEMELAGKTFQPETSDFIITGSITSFIYEEAKSGIGSFLSSGGGLFSNKQTKAKIGVDIRLIDVESSAIKYTESYLSNSKQNDYSFGLIGLGSSGGAIGSSQFKGSVEIEEAMRTVVDHSVFDLIKSIASDAYFVTEVAVE
ncbi:CsgG/HfaB family protein [Thalassotalea marina]|uniref:Curli production assembly/transport component CsgG n=1 Tax=Thalassotalea marina TaxID=1673741 RepID=A0A919BRB2_9GAMM|nr:CsgG/HfaB family protein [Thalassotalea marina]GHG07174.1 hypothetical protein GCM10017161_41110 [Thalassotalea marina]